MTPVKQGREGGREGGSCDTSEAREGGREGGSCDTSKTIASHKCLISVSLEGEENF